MGNACFYLCSPGQGQNNISTDIVRAVEGMQHVEDLMAYIDQLTNKIDRGEQEQVSKTITVASSIRSGGDLTEKFSTRLNGHVFKTCLRSMLHRQTRSVVIDVLKQAQHIQCVGLGLSIIAHVWERAEQVSSNSDQCVHLLRYMSALAKHMKNLDIHLDRTKIENILFFIVKGTLICALQMKPASLCRFISAPVDDADLQSLESQLVHSYQDLEFQALTALLDRLPIVPGPSQGEYPHNAVGIEEAQNKVRELLDLKDPSRRVVVIYGMGGIGKTTLATAVFNLLDLSGYHHCKVYMDQDSKESHLPPMQEKILRDLFKENLKLNDWTQGREKLSEAFGKASKPAFLFIDNALRQADLEKVLPIEHLSRLPMQSRILITTRNLKETKIFELQYDIQFHFHRVDGLSETEAKRLLCHYALGDKNGSFDPAVNVEGLMQICGRIPLVLRIVGSQLRTDGNTVAACNEILKYFREWQQKGFEGGEEDLGERMVDFVYRRLKEPSKEAFLDIAAFFYDWERFKVSDIVGEVQLQDLERAALVTTCEEDKVNVHDIVRARGRKLSEGNRISDTDSLSIILRDTQKLQQTKGIWLLNDDYHCYVEYHLEAKHLDLLTRSLRVLSLGKRTRVSGRCEGAFEDLRFLNIWYEDMLPIDLTKSRKLVFFQGHLMKGHRLPELPESLRLLYLDVHASNSPVSLDISEHLISLRELQLSNITLANFETCNKQPKSLRSLLLTKCGGFSSIPESLGNISCLKMLKVYDCPILKHFPQSFGNLSSMRELDTSRCSMLRRLPESFGNLPSLHRLHMFECYRLERLPESFGNLSSPQILRMDDCSNLERLPESFWNLSSLQILHIDDCSNLERLPESFGNLSSLQMLRMSGCSKFESFGNLSSLQMLRMSGCSKLERIPESFGNLSSMQDLGMSNCSMLETLPESFGNLYSLQRLYMRNCSMLERLPQTFDQLSSLQILDMDGCEKMCSLPDNFGKLKCLKFLNISNCIELKRFPDDMVCLTSLAAMRAYGCAELEAKAMDSLVNIKSLKFLEMGQSPMLEERWKQIQQRRPFLGAALRFEYGKYPYVEIMSTMLFSGGSRFLHVDGEGRLEEAVAPFPNVGVTVGLLLTACDLSNELREKLLEVASAEFQIIYVDFYMEGEAEGSSSMEERDMRIRKTLLQLPNGSLAWTSSFHKTRLLLAYSLWHFTDYFAENADTSILGTRVLVDEEGRRKLSRFLKLKFRRHGCDSRRVDLRSLFSPLLEAWELMCSN